MFVCLCVVCLCGSLVVWYCACALVCLCGRVVVTWLAFLLCFFLSSFISFAGWLAGWLDGWVAGWLVGWLCMSGKADGKPKSNDRTYTCRRAKAKRAPHLLSFHTRKCQQGESTRLNIFNSFSNLCLAHIWDTCSNFSQR